MSINDLKPETLAVHGHIPSEHPDISLPLHLTTTYRRTEDGNFGDFVYSRLDNPNRTHLEQKIAALEGGVEAIAFSSGMAAINALFETVLHPGTHVIIPDDCYHGTRTLLESFFSKWKVDFDSVDMTAVKNIEEAIKPDTKLIWIETPSNPQLKITDLKAVAKLAQNHNIITAADNTFATPLLQKPLDMGIDVVMHSSTKYFGGHSDILGGVIIMKQQNELYHTIREYQKAAGAVPSPFDCWLLNRSLATFPLRFRQQCANAIQIAEFLTTHPKIKKVYYPGLASHFNHDIAKEQMSNGFGAIVSVLLGETKYDALNFARKLKIIQHATSLGGVESLIEHRRSAEGNHPVSPDNLLRISIGVEHSDDLMKDIHQALE